RLYSFLGPFDESIIPVNRNRIGNIEIKIQRQCSKTARTLLKTRRSNEGIIDIPGGKYWYNGIRNCISKYFTKCAPVMSTLSLNVSIDGVPVHNSGKTQLWPIFINLFEMPDVPPIPLVEDLKDVLVNGIEIQNAHVSIKLRAIIADSPARSFIKDIVRDIIVSDPLHLLFLGVFRRFLRGWKEGKLSRIIKWYDEECGIISSFLKSIKLPREIHRQIRPIEYLPHYKGRLGYLKYLLRGGSKQIEQVVNRILELQDFEFYKNENVELYPALKKRKTPCDKDL
uniref:Uncharacterized protein n=1 Tax=Anopheles arabiensis TaxID=7173 RepID=A0A182I5C9_ANOAR